MKIFKVELTGKTPLLHHRMTEAEMAKILFKTKEKKKKVQEDARTPRQIAEEHAYRDPNGTFYIPTSYLRGAFGFIASDYKQTSSRKSMKTIAGGCFIPVSDKATLVDADSGKPFKTFEVQIDKANNRNAGKSVAVIVCRPRFDHWKTELDIQIDEELLSPDLCHEILNEAGRRCGIGSFRVSNGGTYGTFRVTKFEPREA